MPHVFTSQSITFGAPNSQVDVNAELPTWKNKDQVNANNILRYLHARYFGVPDRL